MISSHPRKRSNQKIEVFALISVEPKAAMDVVERMLMRIKEVERIVEVLGPYEILVKFRFRSNDDASLVLDKLGDIKGVKECLILFVTKSVFEKEKK